MATVTNGIQLINQMRSVASADYQDVIPEATKENLSYIGDLLDSLDYAPQRNEFTGMIEKIALTIFNERAYNNQYKFANKGKLAVGTTIEEIAQDLIEAEDFDPEGKTTLVRTIPPSFNFYHTRMSERTYPTTVTRYQIKSAFQSEGSLNRFLTLTINNLYNSYERDEELIFKETLGNMYADAYMVASPRPVDEESAKDFLALLREYVIKVGHYHTEYNPVGSTTFCPSEKLVLLVDAKTISKVSVEALASAFNRGDVDYVTRIVPVDDFGDWAEAYDEGNVFNADGITATAPYAMLIDEDAFLFYEQEVFMDQQHNAEGAFDKLYLHVRKNYAWSKARTIIAFTEVPLVHLSVSSDLRKTGVFVTSNVYDYSNSDVLVANSINASVYNTESAYVITLWDYLGNTDLGGAITYVIEYADGTTSTATTDADTVYSNSALYFVPVGSKTVSSVTITAIA